MKAIIFDMNGVLLDTMPFHYEAMKTAVDEIANIELDKKTFYLLEGMPIKEMSLEIFKLKGYDMRLERSRFRCYGRKHSDEKEGNLYADETKSRIFQWC
jgi:beta-phosphoglucomutase-like phosphatase (HAD superfamily)